jgi:hypothetical protein
MVILRTKMFIAVKSPLPRSEFLADFLPSRADRDASLDPARKLLVNWIPVAIINHPLL